MARSSLVVRASMLLLWLAAVATWGAGSRGGGGRGAGAGGGHAGLSCCVHAAALSLRQQQELIARQQRPPVDASLLITARSAVRRVGKDVGGVEAGITGGGNDARGVSSSSSSSNAGGSCCSSRHGAPAVLLRGDSFGSDGSDRGRAVETEGSDDELPYAFHRWHEDTQHLVSWVLMPDGRQAVAADRSQNVVYAVDVPVSAGGKMQLSGRVVAGQVDVAGLRDGLALGDALFCAPTHVAVDGAGNVFVVDEGLGQLRRISPNGHVCTVLEAYQPARWPNDTQVHVVPCTSIVSAASLRPVSSGSSSSQDSSRSNSSSKHVDTVAEEAVGNNNPCGAWESSVPRTLDAGVSAMWYDGATCTLYVMEPDRLLTVVLRNSSHCTPVPRPPPPAPQPPTPAPAEKSSTVHEVAVAAAAAVAGFVVAKLPWAAMLHVLAGLPLALLSLATYVVSRTLCMAANVVQLPLRLISPANATPAAAVARPPAAAALVHAAASQPEQLLLSANRAGVAAGTHAAADTAALTAATAAGAAAASGAAMSSSAPVVRARHTSVAAVCADQTGIGPGTAVAGTTAAAAATPILVGGEIVSTANSGTGLSPRLHVGPSSHLGLRSTSKGLLQRSVWGWSWWGSSHSAAPVGGSSSLRASLLPMHAGQAAPGEPLLIDLSSPAAEGCDLLSAALVDDISSRQRDEQEQGGAHEGQAVLHGGLAVGVVAGSGRSSSELVGVGVKPRASQSPQGHSLALVSAAVEAVAAPRPAAAAQEEADEASSGPLTALSTTEVDGKAHMFPLQLALPTPTTPSSLAGPPATSTAPDSSSLVSFLSREQLVGWVDPQNQQHSVSAAQPYTVPAAPAATSHTAAWDLAPIDSLAQH